MGQISKRKNNFAIVMRWSRELTRCVVVAVPLLVILWSCADTGEVTVDHDAAYFPLRTGIYQIYDVKETRIDQVNTTELTYQLRTEVTDSFPNPQGGYTYVITRSTRTTPASAWAPRDTWSARADDKGIIVNEENIAYVKLAFPFAGGKSWNGNALNALGGKEKCGTTQETCDIYRLEDVLEEFDAGTGLSFAKTVTVLQNNDTDVIVSQDVRKEIYALDAGLVYKESTILEYCTVGPCLGKQQVENGFIYRQVINEYGDH
jgi:hypothetical protein